MLVMFDGKQQCLKKDSNSFLNSESVNRCILQGEGASWSLIWILYSPFFIPKIIKHCWHVCSGITFLSPQSKMTFQTAPSWMPGARCEEWGWSGWRCPPSSSSSSSLPPPSSRTTSGRSCRSPATSCSVDSSPCMNRYNRFFMFINISILNVNKLFLSLKLQYTWGVWSQVFVSTSCLITIFKKSLVLPSWSLLYHSCQQQCLSLKSISFPLNGPILLSFVCHCRAIRGRVRLLLLLTK